MPHELIYICEICQTVLSVDDERHCKAICPNCGRTFDCSDLPVIAANGEMDLESQEVTPRPGSDMSEFLPRASADGEPNGGAGVLGRSARKPALPSTAVPARQKGADDSAEGNVANLP